MPAPLGPLVGFSLGVLFAWLRGSRLDPSPSQSPGRLGSEPLIALFAALVYAPICAYFVLFAGDWSLAYLVDSRAVPSALELLLIVADAASVLAGFSAARRATERRAFRTVTTLAGAPLAIALLFLLVLRTRLRVDGTFRQVQGDFGTEPVVGGPLGYAILWMNGVLAAGVALTAQKLRPHRRSPAAAAVPIATDLGRAPPHRGPERERGPVSKRAQD